MNRKIFCLIWTVLFFLLGFPVWESFADNREDWQKKWGKLQADARKEGQLTILSSVPPELREAHMMSLRDKFGIAAEFVMGRPAELAQKLTTERRAGLYIGDVMLAGTATIQSLIIPMGYIDSLDPFIFLPEVLDPKSWIGGKLPWVDKDHRQFAFTSILKQAILVNTNLVKPGEIKSWRDLLDPKWRGKIMFDDPSIGGSGTSAFCAIAEGIMGLDYLKQLAKQELIITKDQRLSVEWVAKGKYSILIGPREELAVAFKKAGAPVGFMMPMEGSYTTASSGAVSLMNHAPHPNAASLYINWLLTKEGQTVHSRAMGAQSARIDVTTDFLEPDLVLRPGIKVFPTISAEFASKTSTYNKLAKEIFNIP